MIRAAVPSDRAAMIAMGSRFLDVVYRDVLTGSPSSLGALFDGLLPMDEALLLVDDRDGEVKGMIGAVCFAHPMSGERCATELFWWADPDVRGAGIRLMKAAERWAKNRGAVKMFMVAPTPDVEALYTRLSYTPVERSYQRTL